MFQSFQRRGRWLCVSLYTAHSGTLFPVIVTTNPEAGRKGVLCPILQTKALSPREVEQLGQGHTAYYWKDWNSCPLDSVLPLLQARQEGAIVQPHVLSLGRHFAYTRTLTFCFFPGFTVLSLWAGKGHGKLLPTPYYRPHFKKPVCRGCRPRGTSGV